MAGIFSKIISGELPSYKIYEDDKNYSFLDINPNAVGHTLCIPKKEIDKIFDLTSEDYLDLMSFSRRVGLAIGKAIPCKRIGISVVGLEIAHAHVHLIPLNRIEDVNFQKKVIQSNHELKKTATLIKKFL